MIEEKPEVTNGPPVLSPADREYFTLVFKGNLKEFNGNPLKTETPFGVPVACGYGNAFEQVDALEGILEDNREREFWKALI